MFESAVKSLCGLRSTFLASLRKYETRCTQILLLISILGNATWEGGCVIYLTQHNCLIWKLHSKSWLVLMNRCIWFRGEILCTLKNRADRPWKNKGALDNGSATASILVGCLSCVSKGPCFALDAWALALMTSWEVVSHLYPIHGEHALCQGISQMLVLGTRYKKMLENTLKRHAYSPTCTLSLQSRNPSPLPSCFSHALFFNRAWWFVEEDVPHSPLTDLEPCETKWFSVVTWKISCGATDILNVSGDPSPEETNRVLYL